MCPILWDSRHKWVNEVTSGGHDRRMKIETRMVQLPATAAIKYVAACWVSGAGGFLSE